jgi:hypothetical protein
LRVIKLPILRDVVVMLHGFAEIVVCSHKLRYDKEKLKEKDV